MKLEPGKKYISNCVIKFKKLKGVVETQTGKRYLSPGEWFIPLTNGLQFTWFGISPIQFMEIEIDEQREVPASITHNL